MTNYQNMKDWMTITEIGSDCVWEHDNDADCYIFYFWLDNHNADDALVPYTSF